MADYNNDAENGGSNRYPLNSDSSSESSSSSSSSSESDDDEENAFSYTDGTAAAMTKSPGGHSIQNNAGTIENSTAETMPVIRDLLDGNYIEDKLALAPYGQSSQGMSNYEYGIGDLEETIIFHDEPQQQQQHRPPPPHSPPPPPPATPASTGSIKTGPSPRRAGQGYYDVLEMASSRLRQDNSPMQSTPGSHDSSGDEAVRKKKSKKKKRKSRKEKRQKQHQSEDDDDDEEEIDVRRGSLFGIRNPFTPTSLERDLSSRGGSSYRNDEMDIDPNDDLPSRWNPASLVTAAQSKAPNGKTDKQGFYRNWMGRDSASGRGNDDEQMPENFNLQSIGKPKQKPTRPRRNMPNLRRPGIEEAELENSGIEMVKDDDSYNFSIISDMNNHYLMNEQLVEQRRSKRERRRLCIVFLITFGLFGCLSLFMSRRNRRPEELNPPKILPTQQKIDDGIPKNEPPARPLPLSPIEPTDWLKVSDLHAITAAELQYIVNGITPDASILSNPNTPQSKALEWAKNDMKIYNVEVASRVAQRYCLATLYYATNGTGWQTNANWGNGHECEWYGVGCEAGENNEVSVTYLDLNSNRLDGTMPLEVGYVTSLEQIHLWGNNLVGNIPSTLSRLVKLHTLYLDNNHLDGEMADTFDKLENMKHLDLSGNRLRGHIPHGLGSLTKLRDLRLSNNFLTSTFPISLISLSNLQTLLLDSNAISGTLPSLVGEMRSLVTIRIHENDMKGKLPSFTDAERLEEAHFNGNYFTGPIPHFGSPRLRELYLGQNALTGSIPSNIGNLVKLEILDANANKLNSTIPTSISNASALQFLDLSHNKLSGDIPRGFSNLLWLHEFRLDHNRLRGRFPDWFGTMKRLEIVHLNNNLLGGDLGLSLEMGDLDDLSEFAIENNDLSGVVGEAMCDLLLDVLTADCWGSPPRVDCSCCTECF
mmetsp:Transcript_20496/g.38674  ORF Transcript_20496/g.38674 Transcript_20496/m.38674 type:complete len:931 (-) Transcript_20496:1534-4326(-)